MLILALTALAADVVSQQPRKLDCVEIDRAVAVSKEERVPEARSGVAAQIVAHRALCWGWAIIDIWSSWSATTPSSPSGTTWHARRKHMDRNGVLTTEYLDAVQCPALLTALDGLAAIPVRLAVRHEPPRGSISWPPPPPPPIPGDGVDYTISVRSANQPDNTKAAVSFNSHYGLIETWFERDVKPLDACWRSRP